MALTVTVASTDVDLTSTSALKAEVLGATATSTSQDTRYSNLIRRASRQAESWIGQPLTVQTYRETVAGYGRRSLMLSRTPVRAILAIYDSTSTDEAHSYETSEIRVEDREAGLLSRDHGFAWTATLQWRAGGIAGADSMPLQPMPMTGQEYKPWLIDYVAGYTYNGIDTGSANWSTRAGTTSTGRTLPEDIEAAVLANAEVQAVQPPGGVQSESLGDVSVSYQNFRSADGGMEPWQALLAPYRRVV